jgi:ketosteroid isomerase-like protein
MHGNVHVFLRARSAEKVATIQPMPGLCSLGGNMLERRRRGWAIAIALLLLAGAVATPRLLAAKQESNRTVSEADKFAAAMQTLRDSWVQEFNEGQANKVAALYAPEAVLMRWDGSVHGSDSILAELERSVRDGAHGYTMHSLHVERSGDLGYDTGAYNVMLRDRLVEGNYLVVVKNIGGQWKIVAQAIVPNPQTRP